MARRPRPKYGTYPREKIHLLERRIRGAWNGHWSSRDPHLNATQPVATLRVARSADLDLILNARTDLDYLLRLSRAMARELKHPSGELQFLFREWDELVEPKRPPS